ncbi:hypothetical protein [Pseudoxanthomonas sp. UTMC 1351]|uniref:hypothetical protein n=1 Tax=Pseudoxanthomonas sp. UTMC 1351 TaxID=2695853 RepID=UPI0034CE90AB
MLNSVLRANAPEGNFHCALQAALTGGITTPNERKTISGAGMRKTGTQLVLQAKVQALSEQVGRRRDQRSAQISRPALLSAAFDLLERYLQPERVRQLRHCRKAGFPRPEGACKGCARHRQARRS